MTEYTKRISELKERLEKAKNAKIRSETRLEQLYKQKEEILMQLHELGVDPDHLEQEIKGLRAEIEEYINKADQLLPGNFKTI